MAVEFLKRGFSLDQMIGDRLMAIFGAPIPHQDYCERAVNAARKMLELLKAYNQEQSAQAKLQIKIAIGIPSSLLSHGLLQSIGKTIEIEVFSGPAG